MNKRELLEACWAEGVRKEGFGFAQLLAEESSLREWEEEGFSPLLVGWGWVGCFCGGEEGAR